MDGRFLRVNPAFTRLLGYTFAELKNKHFMDFVHPDDRQATQDVMAELQSGKCILDFVNRQLCRDGTYRWLEWRVSPYEGTSVYALGRDITRRKQAEQALLEAEWKFRALFEKGPIGVAYHAMIYDAAGRPIDYHFLDANECYRELTGVDPRGKSVRQAFPGIENDPFDWIGTFGQVALTGQSIRFEQCLQPTGRWYDCVAYQYQPDHFVAAFLEITARKQIEEELKLTKNELESRVQRRTAQLQERTAQLHALANTLILAEERERTRISRLIHDHLQQLLVASLLNLRMVKSQYADESLQTELENIEVILKDAVETTQTLTAELSPAVLHQYGLAAALKWLRPWCMKKYGLSLEVIIEQEIDPGMEVSVALFLCVRELLFNVVKHARVSAAKLRMWLSSTDNIMNIEVSDQGVGFDPTAVKHHDKTTGGVGLFNNRERIELLGGGLQTDSRPGEGSRFTLWVPLSSTPVVVKTSATRAVTSDAQPATTQPSVTALEILSAATTTAWKTRLVVADDHPTVRKGMIRLFQNEADFEVVGQAADGYEAIQLARQLRPHFVLMDLNMPRMNGLEATAIIRKELPCVKVLGLSAEASDEHRSAMLQAGAVDLLHKNHPISELLATIRSHAVIQNLTDSVAD